MVNIKEYRIVMPLTLDEYERGQLYTTAEYSKQETGGGEGVEILKNEPYTDHPEMGNGQYTYKIYRLASKVPGWVRALVPSTALELHEEAWNGFPRIRTVLTNKYLGDRFKIQLDSYHAEGINTMDNALHLPADVLKKREIVHLDICTDKIDPKDYAAEHDPTKVKSVKTGRGPLAAGWANGHDPIMTVYKVFSCEFRVPGLQDRVENYVHKTNRNLILIFHRKLFCYLDKYFHMTMDDIRAHEERTQIELAESLRAAAEAKAAGTRAPRYVPLRERKHAHATCSALRVGFHCRFCRGSGQDE